MRKLINYSTFIVLFGFLLGCASSIVDGEGVRTTNTVLAPKPESAAIEVYFSGKNPERQFIEVGRVSSRAWVLNNGINSLKENARKLGADAVTNIKYERRFSVDYLQDLYFIDGDAVVWK
jgi:hypothetical protein